MAHHRHLIHPVHHSKPHQLDIPIQLWMLASVISIFQFLNGHFQYFLFWPLIPKLFYLKQLIIVPHVILEFMNIQTHLSIPSYPNVCFWLNCLRVIKTLEKGYYNLSRNMLRLLLYFLQLFQFSFLSYMHGLQQFQCHLHLMDFNFESHF